MQSTVKGPDSKILSTLHVTLIIISAGFDKYYTEGINTIANTWYHSFDQISVISIQVITKLRTGTVRALGMPLQISNKPLIYYTHVRLKYRLIDNYIIGSLNIIDISQKVLLGDI